MTDEIVGQTKDKTESNRLRAMRKRENSRAVKNVREKLSSSTGTRPAFDYELTLGYARHRVASWLPVSLLIVLLAFIGSHWYPPAATAVWAGIVFYVQSVHVLLCWRFTKQSPANVRLRVWRRRFHIGELLAGLSVAAVFALSPNDASVMVFHLATALFTIAVTAIIASNLPLAAAFGTVPIAMTATIVFALTNNFTATGMAVFVFAAEIFLILLSIRLNKSALAMLEHQAEKDALIAELEHAKAISDDSRRRSDEANLAKSRFLATMSHELRTPLNAILGFSEIMKGEVFGPIDNSHYKEYVADIHRSGEHLLNLINEILDLSRIEAGRYQLSEEAVRLTHVVEDCHHLVKLRAKNKSITIHEQFEPGLPKVWADERAIRQIVLNLLSNAVKFTPTNGEIAVKVGWTAGGGQYVSVSDNGPGIPEEEIPIVLSAFGQGSLAIKSAEQGTGLGLPICQALIQMHGGTFALKSKLREGTTVTITIPRARVLEAMPAIAEDDRQLRRA
ncbi:Non-motile and phage-resistance protein [Hartmannibacter diazotrophicus]|uniref:histidine kinase n=1 Tax=Hartmannibacter diazotrophicus TaxID=1482074 RepID=A0A2C9D479_9HYPH|nr:ATP-binding protein [Hartmannibacter diazotrophicus]SON55094.1 Non-motile and phage-resistance protein [Hartmannibacter diazotrophicus]